MRLASTLLALATLSPSPARAAQDTPPTGVVTLAQLRDHFRVLLIFAPKPDDPQLEIQLRTLAEHAPAVSQRDLIAIALPYANPSPTSTTLSAAEANHLRRQFDIPPTTFAVLLIGKDGGEKLRASHPLSIDRLNTTIDAMPMRQQEMRTRPSP
jgi:hypothetical protein